MTPVNPFKRLPHLVASYSPPVLLTLVASLLIIGTLFFRLSSLPANLSNNEALTRQQTTSLKTILDNPVNAPYKLTSYAVQKTGRHSPIALRAVGVVFALLIVAAFFFLIESWHTRRVAIMATIMLAFSSWLLHIARLATPEILQAVLPVILFSGAWLKERKLTRLSLVILIIAASSLLYIPGFIWLVLVAAVWQRKEIGEGLKKLPNALLIPCSLIMILVLAPLVYAVVLDLHVLRDIAGLPDSFPGIKAALDNLISIPTQLFWQGPHDPSRWLTGTPLLDIFCMGMAGLGAYAYVFRLRLDRTRLLIGFTVLSCVLISLGGAVTVTILLPLVYILIAAGLTWLLQQWFTVFPRNPVGRSLGIAILSVVIGLSTWYNLNHYFVAWQKAPATKASFTVHP